MENKKIVLFTTGGTIAQAYDAKLGGYIPKLDGNILLSLIGDLYNNIELEEFCNIDSRNSTLSFLKEVSLRISKILERKDVKSVVILHGTDTMGIQKYFLDTKG